MSTAELKKKIIDQVQSTKSKLLLEDMYRLLYSSSDTTPPLKLSEEQKEKIKLGQNQIKKGLYSSNAEVNREIDKWLRK